MSAYLRDVWALIRVFLLMAIMAVTIIVLTWLCWLVNNPAPAVLTLVIIPFWARCAGWLRL